LAKIEVQPSSGSSYHVSTTEAKGIVARGDGYWDGPRRVIRIADSSKRGIWQKVRSGYAGPVVLQLT
jgi:hypothetical protein